MKMQRTRGFLLECDPSHAFEQLFKAVCQDTSEDLDADLVSVWTFDRDKTKIVCKCSYDGLIKAFDAGQVLYRETFPLYFKTIMEENIVNAPQARNARVTSELTESYFKPLGVQSLLDFILHHEFEPTGVICCENRRSIRYWSQEDEEYLRSIASLTSFIFKPDLNN